MNSNRIIVPSLAQDDQGNLQIHIPKEDFGDFIQGLLAQPRTLRKTEKKFFDIDHGFIKHLNEVIKQRVQSQQLSSLVSFEASIYFADGRVQTMSSWEAFDTFNDNSDYIATRAEIIWGYLVKFPSKPIPEKQTIVISIDTGLDNPEKASSRDIVKRIAQTFVLDNDSSEITIKVEYTELTWGVDILRHLENEIKNRLLIESKITVTLREVLSFLGVALVPLVITFPMLIFVIMQGNNKSVERADFMASVAKHGDFEQSVIERLYYLIANHEGNPFTDSRFWVYVISFLLILTSFALFAIRRPKSYLILNAATEK